MSERFSYVEGLNRADFQINSSDFINVRDAFRKNASRQEEYIIQNFTIGLTNLTTPRTTEATQSFKIYIYDEDGYMQYKKESGITGSVSKGTRFESASIARSNKVNGYEGVVYNFTIVLENEVQRNEYIKIVPPETVTINSV